MKTKQLKKLGLITAITAITFTLTSCGIGLFSGGASSKLASFFIGQFKDANVEGLNYVSGSRSGKTDDQGRFEYEAGKDVTFSIGSGNAIIGTIPGKKIITPIDLVESGNSGTPAVQNIVRFLLALDDDRDGTNGIKISDEISVIATNEWASINFTVSTGFADEVADQIDTLAPTRTITIGSAVDARTHLENTLTCQYAGGYRGQVIDPVGSVPDFGFIVNADDKTVQKIITSRIFAKSASINFATTTLSVSIPIPNTTETITFRDFDTISGTTSFQGGKDISATRIGSAANAKYRFTGAFKGTEYGIFTFDVSVAPHKVTGVAYSVSEDELYTITNGTVEAGILSATIVGKGDIRAEINLGTGTRTGTISDGTWTNDAGTVSSTFIGNGCTLNSGTPTATVTRPQPVSGGDFTPANKSAFVAKFMGQTANLLGSSGVVYAKYNFLPNGFNYVNFGPSGESDPDTITTRVSTYTYKRVDARTARTSYKFGPSGPDCEQEWRFTSATTGTRNDVCNGSGSGFFADFQFSGSN